MTIEKSKEEMMNQKFQELEKELWHKGAVIHRKTTKVIGDGIVALASASPGMREAAIKMDQKEGLEVENIEQLRSKLYLVMLNGKPGVEVYGGEKATSLSDDFVQMVYSQIESEEEFRKFNDEIVNLKK